MVSGALKRGEKSVPAAGHTSSPVLRQRRPLSGTAATIGKRTRKFAHDELRRGKYILVGYRFYDLCTQTNAADYNEELSTLALAT
jgi:hypothetical protein